MRTRFLPEVLFLIFIILITSGIIPESAINKPDLKELKEVQASEGKKLAYEVQAEKQTKLFGFIKKQMRVTAQVNAENGEVIATKKPWWAFLAKETEEAA